MASINQHVSRTELTVQIHKLWEDATSDTCSLVFTGDGSEITIFLNKKQVEEIAGKTMAFLMPELVSK